MSTSLRLIDPQHGVLESPDPAALPSLAGSPPPRPFMPAPDLWSGLHAQPAQRVRGVLPVGVVGLGLEGHTSRVLAHLLHKG
jgi:hypothetical protein